MRKRLILIILPLTTLIFEILPYGAVLIFCPSPIENIRATFSYFSLTPFGYANFGPLLTALNTCLIMILIICYILTNKDFFKLLTKFSLYICIITSLMPLIYGINYFSIVGALITATLILELVLLYIYKSK